MRFRIRHFLAAAAIAVVSALLLTNSAAQAATSEAAVYWNDCAVAKAWFNSGNHNPSKGRNSFTLKVESCGRQAQVLWNLNNTTNYRVISGAGNEVSFSISGASNPCKSLSYQLFAYDQNGTFRSSPYRYDRVC